MGGPSLQPRTDPPRSPINAFPIEELYTPEFLESLQEYTGYWLEPNTYEAVVNTLRPHQRRRRRKVIGRTIWWWENRRRCARPWFGFVRCMAQVSRAGDEDYVQKAMIHYQDETGVLFKFCHCWDVFKDNLKFQEIAFPNFNQGSEGSNKRHKSFGSSSFNTESGDASINLNTTVVDEDEVQKIRRPRGRDQARAATKNKGSKASGSSTMNDNALARLVVNEMTYDEVQQHEAFMELKRREVECRERDNVATKYRAQQKDIKLYLQPYDHLTGKQ
nr:hypothetical protein [Tanacetum cinerariifolium]GEZ63611.1 hypothetical protein [Tanacetum cinerariifolium]